MKIERLIYGMQTADGKILTKYSDQSRVQEMLSPKSRDYIRSLRPRDSHQYLWFKTEQTIAYPVIIEVADKDPEHGGRTFYQNQTFLVNLHDFINHVLSNGGNIFEKLVQPEMDRFPDRVDAVNV